MSLSVESEWTNYTIPELKDKSNNQQYQDNMLPFPYEIRNVDANLNMQLMKDFSGERTGFVEVGPKKWVFPSGYTKAAQSIYNFKLRSDDVFVATFPRSGTTWTQEMVWLLCNNLDFQTAAKVPLNDRFKFLEFSCFIHEKVKEEFLKENMANPEYYKIVQSIDNPRWETLTKSPERRFIKTHLPFSLLPPSLPQAGCKIIYVARNPKDVAVSFYHWNRSIRTQGFLGDFRKYWSYFHRNLQPWTPYWEHLKEGWNMRHEENILFIFYENMNKNLRQSIEKIAAFLGRSYSVEELDQLESYLQFDNFKNNKSVNLDLIKKLGIILKDEEPFVRKGKNGGWKDYFDNDIDAEANEWIEKNLIGTDLRFPA
uniref:Sulfotransferase domain-containing protein n=1 Tax=Dendroctonus ponderosae TaxID=77166 RepID=A0AAR5QBG4_DENPD